MLHYLCGRSSDVWIYLELTHSKVGLHPFLQQFWGTMTTTQALKWNNKDTAALAPHRLSLSLLQSSSGPRHFPELRNSVGYFQAGATLKTKLSHVATYSFLSYPCSQHSEARLSLFSLHTLHRLRSDSQRSEWIMKPQQLPTTSTDSH